MSRSQKIECRHRGLNSLCIGRRQYLTGRPHDLTAARELELWAGFAVFTARAIGAHGKDFVLDGAHDHGLLTPARQHEIAWMRNHVGPGKGQRARGLGEHPVEAYHYTNTQPAILHNREATRPSVKALVLESKEVNLAVTHQGLTRGKDRGGVIDLFAIAFDIAAYNHSIEAATPVGQALACETSGERLGQRTRLGAIYKAVARRDQFRKHNKIDGVAGKESFARVQVGFDCAKRGFELNKRRRRGCLVGLGG